MPDAATVKALGDMGVASLAILALTVMFGFVIWLAVNRLTKSLDSLSTAISAMNSRFERLEGSMDALKNEVAELRHHTLVSK